MAERLFVINGPNLNMLGRREPHLYGRVSTSPTSCDGVRFGVFFQRRFWPAAARIRAAIDDGRLGAPVCGGVLARLNRDAAYYAEPWRGRLDTEGGGVLMTQAIAQVWVADAHGRTASVTELPEGVGSPSRSCCPCWPRPRSSSSGRAEPGQPQRSGRQPSVPRRTAAGV